MEFAQPVIKRKQETISFRTNFLQHYFLQFKNINGMIMLQKEFQIMPECGNRFYRVQLLNMRQICIGNGVIYRNNQSLLRCPNQPLKRKKFPDGMKGAGE